MTTNLIKRTWQHKNKVVKGFSNKYNLIKLVYFEQFESIEEAIAREKQLKAGSRKRKIELIEKLNPHWKDLFDDIA